MVGFPTLIGECAFCHHGLADHWADRQAPTPVKKYRVLDELGNDVTEELFGKVPV